MQAIILAAGMGKRLKDLTKDNTKCMVKVNGVPLIDRMLGQLDVLGLSRIVIVVGYESKKLMDHIGGLIINTPICFVENKIYDKTNNIYSLYLAKEYLCKEDSILLESDLIFEDEVLKLLLDDPRETLALVDKFESWMDGTCVKIGKTDTIDDFVPGSKFVFEDIPQYYKTVNIYKFSKHFSETHYVPFLEAYSKALGNNEYYEQVLRVITMLDDSEIRAKKLSGQQWYEIDDIQDLDIASSMFTADVPTKVKNIQARYGGYWRYPQMLDFCYLVNPFFPPQRLIDELKANFETLLTQYPSGRKVNSLLAAKNFGVNQEHILVGNGAAELIKSLMSQVDGKVGFVRPAFEEYFNRYEIEKSEIFVSSKEGYSYTAQDLMSYFDDRDINMLIIINPDNPSGNYIPYDELIRLIEWCQEKSIRIVVDESFVDFSDEGKSLISEGIMSKYKNLVIIKSISKSYGVPGLRLGILVTADTQFLEVIAADVSIWNINSFAEFYMQIEEKYKNSYSMALQLFKETRGRFFDMLEEIECIKAYPSQANYIMVECLGKISATKLTEILLDKYNILIKDLSSKKAFENRQYIRLAVRTDEDNKKLIDAMKEILL